MSPVKIAAGLCLLLALATLLANKLRSGPAQGLGQLPPTPAKRTLKVTPWNPAGLDVFVQVNSIHNEGDYVVITGKKFIAMFHNLSLPTVAYKSYANSGPYLNYLRLPNYGIELTFASSIAEVFVNGSLHCWLNNTFKGSAARDLHVRDDRLSFIGKNDELVTYSIEGIIARNCNSTDRVKGVATFTSTNHANGLFIMGKNKEFGWGKARVHVTDVPVSSWKVAAAVREDRVLVAGLDENTSTNYFVLLDTNLQVLDRAQIAKPAKDGSIG